MQGGGPRFCSTATQYVRHFGQSAADTQKLVLAEHNQTFIVRIVCRPDKLHNFRVYRYLLPSAVDHIYKWYHSLSFLVPCVEMPLAGSMARGKRAVAAVVGVIANLTAWFALHVLFSRITEHQYGPLQLFVPDSATFSLEAAALVAFTAILIFRLKWNVLAVLSAAAFGGLFLTHI